MAASAGSIPPALFEPGVTNRTGYYALLSLRSRLLTAPGAHVWSRTVRWHTGAVIVAYPIERDVVEVSGPEATAYLQGQLSQDAERLYVGSTTWSFVLQPTGKVDSWARVTRMHDDEFLLDVDGGYGEALAARLQRFLLRTKAKIQLLDWSAVALRGPDAGTVEVPSEHVLRVPAGWPGTDGVDLLGRDVEIPPGVPTGSIDDYEAARIAAGVPAMDAELTEKTIPAEVGQWAIDGSVSFDKGCFTGQELVARIDSRGGRVPRHLRGLVVDGSAVVPPAGAEVLVDGAKVGEVTSSAVSARLGSPIALAYVARAVDPPAAGVVTWEDGEISATVHVLPLLGQG